MADLTNINLSTVAVVDTDYELKREERGRLGLSQAGHECKRWLWYKHNGYPQQVPEGRILRLFQLGNLIEDQMVKDLQDAGFYLHSMQAQVKFEQDNTILLGHADGIIEGLIEAPKTPHLWECKSASKKRFDALIKCGSYKEWNEVYYWQLQFYMVGLKLTRAAAFVYCKDDSRLYMERIKRDRKATIEKLQSIFETITHPAVPDRICPRADFWKAKMCPYYKECFK